MTRIKICGIREIVHSLAAVEAGADFIGLVFAPSSRRITPAKACEIVRAVKRKNNAVEVVGVFVNMPASEVNNIADFCSLDRVQLSGDESWEYCRQIAKPIIKATRVGQQSPEEICSQLTVGKEILSPQKFIPLLDSQANGKYGGTGVTFNWSMAQQVAKRFSVIIAGGLNPDNITQVIKRVAPWGVDVSSGVEVEGVKDIAKIKAFIEVVRRTNENNG